MRYVFALCLLCGAAVAQQQPSLAQYLSLTNAQNASIQQLNNTFILFIGPKNNRLATLQGEISAESVKPAPNPLALGQGYLEIASIRREIAAQESDTRMKVAAQLTSGQTALLQKISMAAVQSSLANDASCGFLADALFAAPGLNVSFINISSPQGSSFASFLLGVPTADFVCPSTYPISIRTYLALTDTEVAGILALQAGYTSLQVQKNNRTADVQVEVRDELAKPVLDPIALGVRYIELTEISGELTAADKRARAASRALLTPGQQTILQGLIDISALLNYLPRAERCHLLIAPAGTSAAVSTFYFPGLPCSLN